MENKIKGMTTCKVCGRDFPLLIEEHYVSKEPEKTGIVALAGGPEPMLWDSIDCPHCGCQNRMQQRYRLTDDLGQDYPLDKDNYEYDDDPVCPFPKGGECYCKDSCSSDCEFHPEYNPHPEREEKD